MKRLGLTPALLSATLFLVGRMAAADNSPAMANPSANRPAPSMRSARAEEILKRFDKNGDGKLDEDEAAEAHEVMLREQMERRETVAAAPGGKQVQAQMLEMFDKNHDGRLDDEERAEMQKYLRERALPGMAAMREVLLREFDRNGDGKIDEAEMVVLERTVRPRMEKNPQQMKRYDTNSDGKLDDTEWAVAREQIVRMLNAPALASAPAPAAESKAAAALDPVKLDQIAQELAQKRAERMQAMQAAAPSGK